LTKNLPGLTVRFDQIRGHRKILELLTRVVQTKTLAHAYVFSGLEGIGKHLTALALSKNLLCSSGEGISCGTCAACTQVDRGSHPDLMMIEPEKGAITIDSIRSLKRELSRKSFSGGYKVCLINDADKMNLQAENALLKTLEEPTPDTVIILITAKPYRLLPTVLSRCQHLKFQPLALFEASELIMEGMAGVERDDALWMASLTGGSPGKAFAFNVGQLKGLRDSWINQTRFGVQNEDEKLFVGEENFLNDKENFDLKLNLLRLWYRDLLLFKIYGNSDWVLNKDKTEEIASQCSSLTLERLLNALLGTEKYSATLEYNANPQLMLEAILMMLNPKKEIFFE
jgi:DNA polymerase-3 subunit delta'